MDGMHLRYGRPLLAPASRIWVGALVVFCAILVAVLGLLFAHQATADQFDHAIDSPLITWLGDHPGLAVRLAYPGSRVPAIVLSAAFVVGCLLVGRLNGAVLAAVAVPATVGLNDGLLKHLVHRTYLGVLAYPSGHTATMFAIAATVAVLLLTPSRQAKLGALRMVIAVATCVVGGVVAVGVIGLRFHYFTDTVAGAAVGIGTVCGLALLLDLPAVRRWLAPSDRPPSAAQEHLSGVVMLGCHAGNTCLYVCADPAARHRGGPALPGGCARTAPARARVRGERDRQLRAAFQAA